MSCPVFTLHQIFHPITSLVKLISYNSEYNNLGWSMSHQTLVLHHLTRWCGLKNFTKPRGKQNLCAKRSPWLVNKRRMIQWQPRYWQRVYLPHNFHHQLVTQKTVYPNNPMGSQRDFTYPPPLLHQLTLHFYIGVARPLLSNFRCTCVRVVDFPTEFRQ